ncbi:putative general stress protein 26 [Bacillus freudenreichii]|nr:putative general stress protein 26 [Bacillus freudenreichii]
MNKKQAKEAALEILNDSRVGTMATVKSNKPHSRYMTFFNDEFTLYTPTSKNTHKVDDIESNPNTHIILGYEGEGFGDEYLEIEGKVSEAEGMKEDMWREEFSSYFDGPDDPDYMLLKIEPEQIRVMNKNGTDPQIVDFN